MNECRIGNFSVSERAAPYGMDKKWLQQEIEIRGRGAQVSLAEHCKISTSVLNKLIRGTRKITAIEADKIREWLAKHPPQVSDGVEQQEPPRPTEAVPAPDAPLPPYRREMPKDVPVYGTVVGGDGQQTFDFELNGNVVDHVRRPPRIFGRADVFAVYVTGESMSPWRKPGQLVYVESAKQARAGDYVLVELTPRDGDSVRPALVKELVAVTPTKVRLSQHNPPKVFDIDRRTVLRILRVMDWDELLGV